MAKFKKGDLVQLKSGGPVMTVDNMNRYEIWVDVAWFVRGRLRRDTFAVEAVVRASWRARVGQACRRAWARLVGLNR